MVRWLIVIISYEDDMLVNCYDIIMLPWNLGKLFIHHEFVGSEMVVSHYDGLWMITCYSNCDYIEEHDIIMENFFLTGARWRGGSIARKELGMGAPPAIEQIGRSPIPPRTRKMARQARVYEGAQPWANRSNLYNLIITQA